MNIKCLKNYYFSDLSCEGVVDIIQDTLTINDEDFNVHHPLFLPLYNFYGRRDLLQLNQKQINVDDKLVITDLLQNQLLLIHRLTLLLVFDDDIKVMIENKQKIIYNMNKFKNDLNINIYDYNDLITIITSTISKILSETEELLSLEKILYYLLKKNFNISCKSKHSKDSSDFIYPCDILYEIENKLYKKLIKKNITKN